jgi:protein phosphatase
MMFRYGAATHRGLIRPNNEDRYVAEPGLGFFAVIDGMGGHASGEFASATIAEAAAAFIRESAGDSDKTWPIGLDPRLSVLANRLQISIRIANRTLATRAHANVDLEGSGATIAAALFDNDAVAITNVGDCRAYRLVGRDITQLTRDHSVVGEQVALGLIKSDDARTHPLRHVVTRAVLGQPAMTVDVLEVSVAAGDRFVLCSDGLHGVFTDNEIAELFCVRDRALQDLCDAAVALTNERGGPDNVTAIVLEAVAARPQP